jgi:hypothetical protein
MTEKPNLIEYLLVGPKVDKFEILRELRYRSDDSAAGRG